MKGTCEEPLRTPLSFTHMHSDVKRSIKAKATSNHASRAMNANY